MTHFYYFRVSISVFIVLTIYASKVHAVGSKLSVPVVLSDGNWTLATDNEWLIEFYAPWCPACRNLQPTWDKLAQRAEHMKIQVGKVDVTLYPALSGVFLITALPTIYHVKDGSFRVYESGRDLTDFTEYISNKQYLKTEPLPWFKSPTAIHMRALGWFMKLALMIKDFHTHLTEVHGFAPWMSYAALGLGTLFFGLLIGFCMIVTCDFFLPPRAQAKTIITGRDARPVESSGAEGNGDEEEEETEEDVIEDSDEKSSPKTRKRNTRKDQ